MTRRRFAPIIRPVLEHAIGGLDPAPFRTPEAHERLERLGRRFPDDRAALEAACQLAPDPDLALLGAERFADAAGALPRERDLMQALALLCGASRLVAGLLAREPRLLRRAARSPRLTQPRTEPELRRLLARAGDRIGPEDVDGFHRLLRRLRAREVIRIALRDLRRARMSEVTEELSALAAA